MVHLYPPLSDLANKTTTNPSNPSRLGTVGAIVWEKPDGPSNNGPQFNQFGLRVYAVALLWRGFHKRQSQRGGYFSMVDEANGGGNAMPTWRRMVEKSMPGWPLGCRVGRTTMWGICRCHCCHPGRQGLVLQVSPH